MRKLFEVIVEAAQDKKAKNIVALDMRGVEGAICDTMVVCNADSTTHVGAIAEGIEREVQERLHQHVWRIDGAANALWVAMDYVDVVVHVFQTEMRDFYKLEQLWADAPLTRYESEQ